MNFIKNWFPEKILNSNGSNQCQWINLENIKFDHPFFDETIVSAKHTDINSKAYKSVSDMDLLQVWSEEIDSVYPTAFIFHISRCGSTLLSQLLGLNDAHISLSEVPFFDDILRSPFKRSTKPDVLKLLASSIKLYGQKRTGIEKQLFIKLDSWHICFWKQIRTIYPDVPFILLYRNPLEVLKSNQKLRGMQAVPGIIEPEVFGFRKTDIEKTTDLDQYFAKVLRKYFETYLQVVKNDKNSYLLNYNEGSLVLIKKIYALTGLNITKIEEEQFIKRTAYHSKYPDKKFSEDQLTSEIPEFMKDVLGLYHEIERTRVISGNSNFIKAW